MTIHAGDPFAAEPDPVRRLRGRLGGAVCLLTAGGDPSAGVAGVSGAAGLTATSVMAAAGEVPRLLVLLDPDADLTELAEATGEARLALLGWRHRHLAEVFAGLAPSPGGMFRSGEFEAAPGGPRLVDALAGARLAWEAATEVGWSVLVTFAVHDIEVAAGALATEAALLHRRGRYRRLDPEA